MSAGAAESGAAPRPLPPPIPLTAGARRTHGLLVAVLSQLRSAGYSSPLDPRFMALYHQFTALLEQFQHEVLEGEGRTLSCARGCTCCCSHWVEDVNSFEAEIIAERVRQAGPELAGRVVAACRADVEAIEALDEEVDRAVRAHGGEMDASAEVFDHTDLLLGSFYRLRRPCPLLGSDGLCLVYDVRPITCRIYVSFSDPRRCDPDYVDESDVPTCLLDIEESANSILDDLHAQYDRFDNDTSLRSLLLKLLA